MKDAFIYIWKDRKRKKYYIGSHIGNTHDGYICSSIWMNNAYRKRPQDFKRRILENCNSENVYEREKYWLSMIKDVELNTKYYNAKKVPMGGDIYSLLPESKKNEIRKKCSDSSKKFWKNIDPESYKKRVATAFGGNNFDRDYLRSRNKVLCKKDFVVIHPNGIQENLSNVSEFCQKFNLNYSNFKTMLRGNGKVRSVSGYTGQYL